MKTIIAIGGFIHRKGDASKRTLPIDSAIVKHSGKKHPKALFIPTASSDSKKYVTWFEKMYRDTLKCETEVLYLFQQSPSTEELKSKILSADIIYVGGGNTLKMMRQWRYLGVDKLLKKAYQKGTLMCGVSAGSICWFEWGVSDSMQYYRPKSHEYIKVKGLGFLKGLNCPHFRSKTDDKGYRSAGLKKMSRKIPGKAIVIEDGCAVMFKDNTRKVISFAGKGQAYSVSWKGGKYVIQNL